jgi:hypothetical protein
MLGDVRGIVGFTFVDFGNNFKVADPKGEKLAQFLLSSISPEGLEQ